MSEKSLTQRFDDSMSSLSSEAKPLGEHHFRWWSELALHGFPISLR